MFDVSKLTKEQLVRLVNNRWRSGDDLWSEIQKIYNKNKRTWQNNPEWLANVSPKRSRARDNRSFVAMESVIANLTGRPSKPNAIPANKTPEAAIIADNLQDFFLAKYRDLGMKKKMRQGLRKLFLTRMIVMKPFWDAEKDDFDEKPVDPLKIRCNLKENWFVEEIETPIIDLIDKFPAHEEAIKQTSGHSTLEDIYVNNPKVIYREAWIADYLICILRDKVLYAQPNPYWDWEGIKMIKSEVTEMAKKSGQRRRARMTKIKSYQEYRKKAADSGKSKVQYETYLYNHLDRPMPPYIIGTIFDEGDEGKPIGETSLMEQSESLQLAIDERKRGFSDNADMMNGTWKIDTNIAKISKADAQRAKADPKGIIYGPGVKDGVTRETGKELPAFLHLDMVHSITDLDNIWGTQPTFRGEKGAVETATGRAIMREQSFQRLNEVVDVVDSIHEQSYNWWLQFVKIKYTEKHLTKPIGSDRARETIELTQDDIEEGVEVRVIPGQIMPEDRLFKAERATEAAKAGLIDPLSYFEATDWDDPMKQAKRLEMYKVNPFSILDMTDEEMTKLQEAMQQFGQPGEEGGDQDKANQVAQVRKQAEDLIKSPEFQRLPAGEKKMRLQEIRDRLQTLIQAK